MLPRIISVRPDRDYRIWIRFSDGAEGIVDLGPDLSGPLFGPLREPALFAQLRFDPDIHTVVWPNGADLAPEYLRSLLEAATAA